MIEDIRCESVQPTDFIHDAAMVGQQITNLLAAFAIPLELSGTPKQRLGSFEKSKTLPFKETGRRCVTVQLDQLRLFGKQV